MEDAGGAADDDAWATTYESLVGKLGSFSDDMMAALELAPTEGSFFFRAVVDSPVYFALAYGCNSLSSALDTLRTFVLAEEYGREVGAELVSGNAGLMRQALENAALAHWLIVCDDVPTMSARGLAAMWDDLYWQRKFDEGTGVEGASARAQKRNERAFRIGREAGLIPVGKTAPTLRFPGHLALCGLLAIDAGIVDDDLMKKMPGLGDGGIAYQWASGMAHGKTWAMRLGPFVPSDTTNASPGDPVMAIERIGDLQTNHALSSLVGYFAVTAISRSVRRLVLLKTGAYEPKVD